MTTGHFYRTLIFLLWSSIACAQRHITVEDFTARSTFEERSISGVNWMKDGRFYSSQVDNKIITFSTSTRQPIETLFDGDASNVQINGYALSRDERKILIETGIEHIYRRSFRADYLVFDRDQKTLKRLSAGGKESYATFSPDGSRVAFARNNNLFVVALADMRETQITDDGKINFIINGSTDWVYEEEFSFVKAFFWSPDSRRIAYYRFDESDVKTYTLQLWGKSDPYPEEYDYKYPKAGEANSIVGIKFYELTTGKSVTADLGSETDIYIPRVMWTSNPSVLSVRKLNRLQNDISILHIDADSGVAKEILNEHSDTYFDLEYCDDLMYLGDGTHFIRSSEQSGSKHIYLYDLGGKLVRQITSGGDWEVVELVGVDEHVGKIYYRSTEGDHKAVEFYSIGIDGKNKTRLSVESGTHKINMSPDFKFYMDYFSSADQPLQVRLFQTSKNKQGQVLEDNAGLKKTLSEYGVVKKNFFTFKAADGETLLDGYMLRPADFDSNKKYPVLLYQYSGPRSSNVRNEFAGSHYFFHQMLVQEGYMVVLVDTRGTGFRGEHFAKLTYKQLGKYELEDLVAAAKYLSGLSYVDGNRMGIWGWSYGGYMTALAMTRAAGTFHLGIAVSPVTNWRFYDTVYTERYLQRPQDNASGYDDNSPTTYAARLKGDFLLVHGTGDDNVHFQNSAVFVKALVDAGKQFSSFYYPDKNHGLAPGIESRKHLYTMMDQYIQDHL